MKVLLVNECHRYYYPNGITSLEQFIEYANAHFNKLTPLKRLSDENCVNPYFIEEENKTFYLNVANVRSVTEEEIIVLPKEEYERRLAQVVKKLCVNCVNYEEELDGDNLKGHREKLCLDGTCWAYAKKDD